MKNPSALLATLRFDSVEHPWLWIVLLLAGACILGATYRGIFQRSERRLTWVLMGLRAVGLLALVLALAKPTWTRESNDVDPGRVAVVLDNSLSMSLPDPSGKSRYALAREVVTRLRAALEAKQSGPRLVIELADINGAPLKADAIPDQPTVERTDLTRAVTETVSRLRSRPLAGVLVISDGMDNTGRHDFRDLGGLPVPVYGIGFRSDPSATDFDLALKSVRAPERVLVNNQLKVDVVVSKTGGPAVQGKVHIKLGTETQATQPIAFGAGNGEQTISVPFTPARAGNFVFTAVVEAETGERFLGNNSRHFPLQVEKERIRVLYIEGFLRYEYKFLKARLQDDPDIRLVPLVRAVRPERTPSSPGKDLLTADGLKNFDVVILGDMEAGYLSEAEYRAAVRWLDEKGHAVLVLGGYRSFGPDGFRTTPLADVLPVVFADRPPYQSEEPFILQLTEEGKRHPIFELTGDHEKDARQWAASPPLAGSSLVLRAKPSAETLAVNPNVLVEGKPAVVAAVQRIGAGHSMVLTVDTTWRWSRLPRVLGQSDTLYARFWSQTMRWLSGRGADDRRPLLVVSTDRPDYDVGKKVTIRVQRQPRSDTDLAGTDVGVEVIGPGGKVVPATVRVNSAAPDTFTADFYPPAGGRYGVAATLTKDRQVMANQASEFLVHGPDVELADTGTNRENLRALAAATGGVYVDIEDAERIADKIPPRERRRLQVVRTEFWNSPLLFGAFLVAVTAEWVIRRRNHLV
jgi:hypothetical protein